MRFPVLGQSLFKSTVAIAILLFICATTQKVGAATIVVPNGGDLQAAINASNCGDEIILQAGATFAGNFILRYKGPCSGTDTDYIIIRTSDLAGIPSPGMRITNQFGLAMPKLLANTPAPALEAEANAHHYRLIGIELTNVGGATFTPELILIGARSSGGSIPFVNHPHHLGFDRCWIHEATNDTFTPDGIVTTADRGMNINATDITITESRIAGFRTFLSGNNVEVEASNAILFPNSARRVTVKNSYLESWFVPIFFGGSSGESPNVATLTEVTFDSNNHRGSARFSTVQNLSVGDLIAFKTNGGRTPVTNSSHPNEPIVFQVAKVTNIDGNTVSFSSWGSFDGNLAGGNPLLQAPDSPGQAQWNGYLNQDITISRNTIMINFNSTEQVWVQKGGSPTTQPRSTQTSTGSGPKGFMEFKMAKDVTIDGNTFDGWMCSITLTARNQGSSLTSGGFPWSGVFNINITNNWFKHVTNWDRIYSSPIGGPLLQDNEYSNVRSGPILIQNNLIEMGVEEILTSLASADNVSVIHNTYPGSRVSLGGKSLVFAHSSPSNNLVLRDNIISNNEYGMNCQIAGGGCYPGLAMNGNVIIDNRSDARKSGDGPLDSHFPNNFITSGQGVVAWIDPATSNYRLAASSPYKGRGTGATDPGVDMEQLLAALGGTLPSPTPTPTPTVTPNPTPNPTPVPSPTPTPNSGGAGETVWLSGALPSGATGFDDTDGWQWMVTNPTPFSAPRLHQSIVSSGTHQHYFANASSTLTFNLGEVFFTYVYLDPNNSPDEIMLQWSTNSTDFDHRAYWGANNIAWGTSDTESRRYMGPLPASGQWARLEIPARVVGLEGMTISGMAFSLHGGKASWDRSGKAGEPAPSPSPSPPPTPMPSPSPTPTPGTTMRSPVSVLTAKEHATDLVGQMGTPSFHHAGGTGHETFSASQLVSDLDSVTNDIVIAHQDFQSERALFGSAADRIETQLSAALLFARANTAVASKTGAGPSVEMHLERIISHLAITEDLMLYGSISAMTADEAAAAKARMDLVIGDATTGYEQQVPGLLAPSSLSRVFGSAQQPLCDQASFASSYATGPLPYELGGVSVIMAGHAAQLVYVSTSQVAFVVPSEALMGSVEVIVTSQDGYVSRGVTTIARNIFRIMTSSEGGRGEAIAMNLTKQTNGFDIITPENFGPDKRTRVVLFAVGITAGAANSDTTNDVRLAGALVPNFAESVAVEAHISNGQTLNLPVEFAGAQTGTIGLDQVNVRLIPELRTAGTVELTLIIAGQRS